MKKSKEQKKINKYKWYDFAIYGGLFALLFPFSAIYVCVKTFIDYDFKLFEDYDNDNTRIEKDTK